MEDSDQENPEGQQQNDDYEHLSQAEDYEDYKIDGYHPAYIGESYNNGKYKIVQKLSWGHFSTVWMAQGSSEHRPVCLKIQKSKKSYQESAQDELDILNDMNKHEKDEAWEAFSSEQALNYEKFASQFHQDETYNIKLLDNFVHFGMHGKHYCTVFDLMGPNLLDLIQHFDERKKTMELWLVKLIARQMLIGFVYLHDICGLIHTDIKPENVMIQLQDEDFDTFVKTLRDSKVKPLSMKFLKSITESHSQKNKKKYDKKKKKKAEKKAAELKAQGKEPQPVAQPVVAEPPPVPEKTSEPVQENDEDWEELNNHDDLYTLIWKDKIPINLNENFKIKVVDFGNACWKNKKFTDNIQTREYRAPETIIGAEYEANTDIWSFACLIFELLTNNYLFKPEKQEDAKKSDVHLAMFQDTLGKIPKQFALSGSKSKNYFNKNGQLIKFKDIKNSPISKILVREFELKQKDAQEIEEFLKPMLEYDPKNRISAREALKSKWLWK